MTKHRVFSGPGFALAQELGDAADGGQVLLSHDAWLNLRHSMCDAGFPQVEQLGMYKLEAWPAPLWIYQVFFTICSARSLVVLHWRPTDQNSGFETSLEHTVDTLARHTAAQGDGIAQLIRIVAMNCVQ